MGRGVEFLSFIKQSVVKNRCGCMNSCESGNENDVLTAWLVFTWIRCGTNYPR
jgi:hypothetical protein